MAPAASLLPMHYDKKTADGKAVQRPAPPLLSPALPASSSSRSTADTQSALTGVGGSAPADAQSVVSRPSAVGPSSSGITPSTAGVSASDYTSTSLSIQRGKKKVANQYEKVSRIPGTLRNIRALRREQDPMRSHAYQSLVAINAVIARDNEKNKTDASVNAPIPLDEIARDIQSAQALLHDLLGDEQAPATDDHAVKLQMASENGAQKAVAKGYPIEWAWPFEADHEDGFGGNISLYKDGSYQPPDGPLPGPQPATDLSDLDMEDGDFEISKREISRILGCRPAEYEDILGFERESASQSFIFNLDDFKKLALIVHPDKVVPYCTDDAEKAEWQRKATQAQQRK